MPKRVIAFPVERDVFFVGRSQKVAELLSVSDVCALSSTAEGFSNAILEYMAAARPVVVTDVGGAREAVIEGETGYLVSAGCDEQMADQDESAHGEQTAAASEFLSRDHR